MIIGNSATNFGSVTKTFHWLTAILIFSTIPLGILASDLAHAVRSSEVPTTEADAARAALLFSLHKTIGVTIFFVALARILWALCQPRPGLLNGDNRPEALAAETVHWLLYGSLVAVPLSGWIHHASTSGFAPIWWPFGQDLPFVTKDERVAKISGTLHYVLQWVLIGAIALHVVGALKHHFVDRDATLRRMLPGRVSARPPQAQPGHALPLVAALALWAVALGGAGALGWFAQDQGARAAQAPLLAEVDSGWQVQEGMLGLTITQLGSEVEGRFSDWTAEIHYEEEKDAEGRHGTVMVTISIPSLTLGSVTDQALGSDYLAAETHPTAKFEADLLAEGDGHIARGTLSVKGETMPVEMPFTLTIDGDTASASGGLTIDRRNFGIGEDSEGSLAGSVDIAFELTAKRN